MKKQPDSGGQSYVHAVLLLWFGFRAASTVAPAISKAAAVKENLPSYDQQIAEMHDDALSGLEGYLRAHDEMDKFA